MFANLHDKRFHVLHSVLTVLPDKKVDHSLWRQTAGMSDGNDPNEFLHSSNGSCGGGLAASLPIFISDGLTYDTADFTVSYVDPDTDQSYTEWEAVAQFFGLTESQAKAIFSHNTNGLSLKEQKVLGVGRAKEINMSDRQLLMRRIRLALKAHYTELDYDEESIKKMNKAMKAAEKYKL